MKASLGNNATRKKLADISNIPEEMRFTCQNEKAERSSVCSKEFLDKLQKENMALMKIVAEKKYPLFVDFLVSIGTITFVLVSLLPCSLIPVLYSKIIELAGAEIQKMRINLQQMQKKNHELAQSNSQMLAELNSAKDRLKAVQHELGCKNGLIKAKKLEAEEIAKQKMCQQLNDEVKPVKCEEAADSSLGNGDNDRPAKFKRKPQSKSLDSNKQVQPQDMAENKRPCVRRQSARFKREAPEHTTTTTSTSQSQATKHDEDYSEAEDKCPPMVNLVQQNGSDLESNAALRFEPIEFGRSSLSRPLRHAAKKVQSYKEIPVNIKMRRPV
ncbi:SHUGOSHIN 2-like isoform X1 [Lycium barbarum]|uniref:SHUGOSHIN 2-like isoform X1 n=1 Tax=Lycium barbarum TaxID=112863 RepID=UPI00293EA13D|nr:SHUGOSHIN 2-like isoform X1 [Lycium barbarum]